MFNWRIFTVRKTTEAMPDPKLPLGDRSNMAFTGTVVTCMCLMVATGLQTVMGEIAQMIMKPTDWLHCYSTVLTI